MADYTDYHINCYIDIYDPQYKEIVRCIDWLCNGQSRQLPEPSHGIKNPYWNRISWGCEKIHFNKHTGALVIISSDGVKANPIPEFIEYIKPAIVRQTVPLTIWWRCESDGILNEIKL